MSAAEFAALINGLDRAFRYAVASALYRYVDLRARGYTRAQARQAVLGVRRFDLALRATATRGDFRDITD